MGRDDLHITVPSFFRCPISLDVMKSPVSLSTGVTYDRDSIQRWLENGNNTCPATMQVLDTKDFVPNHTLQRLIQIWANNSSSSARTRPGPKPKPEPELEPQFYLSLSSHQVLGLINQVISSEFIKPENQFECYLKILCFASESMENRRFLGSNDSFVEFLLRIISDNGLDLNPDLLEAILKILQLIITTNYEKNPKLTSLVILKRNPNFLNSMSRILNSNRSDSLIAVASILESIAPDPESKKAIFDESDILTQLLKLLKSESEVVESILSCFISISSPRRNKLKLIRAGGVRILGEMMIATDHDSSNSTMELTLTLLEIVAGCTEGRTAIGEDPNCVPKIVQKLMKVSSSANEHGVGLLWSLCYLFRDQKAKEAVIRSNGGLTKILLLMQSNCSPAMKRMCCDLLRIFRVNSKSCLFSYDTKTTHIMPC